MGQVSGVLRKAENGHSHWCPGCEGMHVIPSSWDFDGNVDKPTFNPSVRITYNGPDAGQERDYGRAPSACCHYFLHAGQLQFCSDSTHELSGKTVALPPLPHQD